jgi:hypothetical protein
MFNNRALMDIWDGEGQGNLTSEEDCRLIGQIRITLHKEGLYDLHCSPNMNRVIK